MSIKLILVSLAALILSLSLAQAGAQFRVVYAFSGGRDGGAPDAGLVDDALGNLYGTTDMGGRACHHRGCGTVFKIAPDGSESVLYAFTGQGDGAEPQANLLRGPDGTLYGTTVKGGAGCGEKGCGTIFSIDPGGAETTLLRFDKSSDGTRALGTLIMDGLGNLYGTASERGPAGFGTAFELAPNGTFTVLHAFADRLDGGFIFAGLLRDRAGDLFGATVTGGANQSSTVYEIAADGTFSVLHAFDGHDGFGTVGSLISDASGNLYGTAFKGGTTFNGGAVYKLAPDGTETVLYNFTGGADGQFPNSQLIFDKDGNLYGTTIEGGAFGQGTVYKVAPDGTETVLYSFTGSSDGGFPVGGVVLKRGHLYGAAFLGGTDPTACGNLGCGTIYEVKL
jgi:uncharacterized repeat protein (TIGR03803 family)